jgi:hypothetical protein
MTYNGVVELGGRMITFLKPTDGQLELLARVKRTLARGTDDAPADFWATQIDRLGQLLDNLIVEADRDIVEKMIIEGKIGSVEILQALFASIHQNEQVKTTTTGPVAAVKRARVR